MTLFVLTIGFDEKFAARFMLRNRMRESDLILIVVPSDWERNEKAKTAIENVTKLASALILTKNIEVFPIKLKNLEDPFKAVEKIKEIADAFLDKMRKRGDREVRACLSGGLRGLIILVYSALAILGRKGIEVNVEIDFENLEGMMEIPLSLMSCSLSEREMLVLRAMSEGNAMSIQQICEITKKSKSTIYRSISSLIDKGFVEKINKDYRISERGEAYLAYIS